jgi:fatty-acyl-CoA synthase
MSGGSTLDTSQQLTLKTLFVPALERYGDRAAVVQDGVTTSYRQLSDQANRLAHVLRDLGVGPGVAVAFLLSNRVEFLVADQAVLRLGAIKVPLNTMLSPAEVSYILRDSGAAVAIVEGARLPMLDQQAAPRVAHVITVDSQETTHGKTFEALLATAPVGELSDVHAGPDDVGLLMYTGGTTGRPKGIEHTQQALAVNLLAHVIEASLLDDERMLLTSPLPHSAGFLAQAGLVKGATLFLERRFHPGQVLDHIERDRITFTFMVPTMIYRLLDQAEARDLDVSSLRTLLYGAAPITAERLAQGLRRLGPVFMQLYGQSEAPNFLTRLSKADHELTQPNRLASCGRPVALMDVAVLADDGTKAAPGQPGEICARGPYVMARYHGLPDTTAETLRDGWLHTGDLGYADADGYVYLLDRKHDMIITGGLNVYSTEVENVLAQHPDVTQVAVVGIPHPDWGEAVVAFVVPTPGTDLDEADLAAHCKAELSSYKRPKAFQAASELPSTAYGKVDKKALRAAWPGW